jgi:hypothetical protein
MCILLSPEECEWNRSWDLIGKTSLNGNDNANLPAGFLQQEPHLHRVLHTSSLDDQSRRSPILRVLPTTHTLKCIDGKIQRLWLSHSSAERSSTSKLAAASRRIVRTTTYIFFRRHPKSAGPLHWEQVSLTTVLCRPNTHLSYSPLYIYLKDQPKVFSLHSGFFQCND